MLENLNDYTDEIFIIVLERTSNKQIKFAMVSINVTAFLTPVLTDFNFAPTYFKLLPAESRDVRGICSTNIDALPDFSR